MAKYKKSLITNRETIAELKRLSERAGGLLMPQDIVQAARSPKSPLHSYFDWNDSEAAEKWRLEQARRLLRVTVELIPVEGGAVPTRVFCSLSTDRDEDGGYRPLMVVLANETMRNVLLADALRDIDIFSVRYAALREVAGIIKEMNKLRKKLK